MPRSRIIIIGAAGLVILFLALLFLGVIPGLKKSDPAKTAIKLNFWGVFESKEIIDEILKSVPGYEVVYREFDPQTYEAELVNALAAGRGPDIFMIHSSWLPKHADKLSPIATSQLQIGRLRDLFPTVVEQDFAPDGGLVYALPLYIDTLAMLYNQTIFDSEGIALTPKNWEEFQNLIPRLRELGSDGRLIKAAAAIGGSAKSVSRAADLLSVLMLQAGVPMVAPDFSRADFSEAGRTPLEFYTHFANPASEFYTWHDAFLNSLDSFAQEKTAIIFNYSSQVPVLQDKNPFLEIGVAPLPQPKGAEREVNYASYWGLAVANKFSNPLGAWNFIWALTINEKQAGVYGEKTGRLPALRTLLGQKLNDPILGVFARQALSARSWPQIDNLAIEAAFSKMIEDAVSGRLPLRETLQEAERTITALMERRGKSF